MFALLWLGVAVGQSDAPTFRVNTESPRYLLLLKANGKILVGIYPDGTIEYGPDYKPDKAAKQFWESLGEYFPCPKPGRLEKK
jgi:hypothetical protein